jgi:diguanylate cyclase (GGDEF)-like protein
LQTPKQSAGVRILLGLAGTICVLALGFVDFITGHEYGFSLFYLLPIAWVTWRAGRFAGLFLSAQSAILWLVADIFSGHVYSTPTAPLWNTLIRLGFFLVVEELLVALRRALDAAQHAAHTDALTGALNPRSFEDQARMEMARARRYERPFALAYLDIDGFKAINDRLGHNVGDSILRRMTARLQQELRRNDIVARLGGDEFALLFPETDEEGATNLISRLRNSLEDEMGRMGSRVTFSIGLVVFWTVPVSISEMTRQADELMYEVKAAGRDGVRVRVHGGRGEEVLSPSH